MNVIYYQWYGDDAMVLNAERNYDRIVNKTDNLHIKIGSSYEKASASLRKLRLVLDSTI